MLRHLKNEHLDINISRRDDLNKQIKEIEYIQEKQCRYCDKKFARRENLLYHTNNSCVKNQWGKIIKISKNADKEQFDKIFDMFVKKYHSIFPDRVIYCADKSVDVRPILENKVDTSDYYKIRSFDDPYKYYLCTQEILEDIFDALGSTENGYYRTYNMTMMSCIVLKYLYFNESHPENHSLYVDDPQLKYFYVYNGIIWEKYTDMSVLKFFYKNQGNLLLSLRYHLYDEIRTEKKFRITNRSTQDAIKSFDRIRYPPTKEMLQLAYDNREIVKKTLSNKKYQPKSYMI